MFFQYILLGFVFAAGIGPVNIETAKRGLTSTSKSAFLFYLGNVIIDAFYILVIIFGFSFFVENPVLKIVLGIFGVLYLVYLGVGNIRDFFKKSVLTVDKKNKNKLLTSFFEGIMVNIANPMAIASWIAFYGVISEDFTENLVVNFLAVITGAILVGVVVVFITHFFRRIMSEKIMKIVSLVSGIVLIVFSLVFAYNLVDLLGWS
ncbi:LysE family transporter [Candidatus Peregrinibacteria bacterium]|mgnify:FL=1|jgi:L-lysine exporter family protein LysE/ArgO|nr:LysE family transporter [Candidatus Peregrinibacteria bacterium]MBT4055748.1 LysE family transporter [Candidatus Peregrinibacteria bacterium]